MAQDRPVPAGEYRGEGESVPGKPLVPDRVDPAMDPPQPARFAGTVNMTIRQAQVAHLPIRNDSELHLGQLRQRRKRAHFFPHTGNKCAGLTVSPQGTSVRLSRIELSGCL